MTSIFDLILSVALMGILLAILITQLLIPVAGIIVASQMYVKRKQMSKKQTIFSVLYPIATLSFTLAYCLFQNYAEYFVTLMLVYCVFTLIFIIYYFRNIDKLKKWNRILIMTIFGMYLMSLFVLVALAIKSL